MSFIWFQNKRKTPNPPIINPADMSSKIVISEVALVIWQKALTAANRMATTKSCPGVSFIY